MNYLVIQVNKFFDYISTVIPIINPSNSKDKLKKELQIRGYEDIEDDDLESKLNPSH